ncbi:MAG: endonuclease III [Planctomycetia bacterium]|nr:endonuclease III [Planctomycetia bacterium]
MIKNIASERKRAAEIIQRLKTEYPDAQCSLNYKSDHQLLVATILSAQCTDKRVNQITLRLFKKYDSVERFAYCNVEELSQDIRSAGYHNSKARSIQGSAIKIIEEYDGQIPTNMTDLVKLPGVGRKTANCVLGECFNVPSMVIDTHMIRIMNLLGFGDTKSPAKMELELMEIFDKKDWVKLTHLIIDHGRAVCIARRPQCDKCVLSDLCPSVIITN